MNTHTDSRGQVRLLTLENAANMLSISKRTLERLISAGDFPRPFKLGRSSRVAVDDVNAYLDRLRVRSQGGRA